MKNEYRVECSCDEAEKRLKEWIKVFLIAHICLNEELKYAKSHKKNK